MFALSLYLYSNQWREKSVFAFFNITATSCVQDVRINIYSSKDLSCNLEGDAASFAFALKSDRLWCKHFETTNVECSCSMN